MEKFLANYLIDKRSLLAIVYIIIFVLFFVARQLQKKQQCNNVLETDLASGTYPPRVGARVGQ